MFRDCHSPDGFTAYIHHKKEAIGKQLVVKIAHGKHHKTRGRELKSGQWDEDSVFDDLSSYLCSAEDATGHFKCKGAAKEESVGRKEEMPTVNQCSC